MSGPFDMQTGGPLNCKCYGPMPRKWVVPLTRKSVVPCLCKWGGLLRRNQSLEDLTIKNFPMKVQIGMIFYCDEKKYGRKTQLAFINFDKVALSIICEYIGAIHKENKLFRFHASEDFRDKKNENRRHESELFY